MKYLLLILFSSTALLLADPVAADTESDIRAALSYYAEIWDDGEIETIAAYYHQDFVLVTSNGPISREQRIDDLKSVAQAGEDRGELSYSNVTVKELGSDHAMAYGRLSLQFKDGSSINSWFTTVYVKTPFGWKAILMRS